MRQISTQHTRQASLAAMPQSDNHQTLPAPRQELVSLLRGYAACPLISQLGEIGLLDRMLQSPFSEADFPQIVPGKTFPAILDYLISLGLISEQVNGTSDEHVRKYFTTPLGKVVFKRFGGACLLHSYRDYFDHLGELLLGKLPDGTPTVNRARNVLGSGRLHALKFFPAAYQMLASRRIDRLVDLGCGDGTFLAEFQERHSGVSLVGVDISEVAVSAMEDRLRSVSKDTAHGIVANAFLVESWAAAMRPFAGTTAVTGWFVVHEFAQSSTERAIEFFQKLHKALPISDVIIGEIIRIPPHDLAMSRHDSIMPEYMLFHTLSGQGVLTWEQFQQVLRSIPYCLVKEVRLDEVPSSSVNGGSCPSSFVWHLRPTKTADESHGWS